MNKVVAVKGLSRVHIENNMLIVYMPNAKCFGIKFYYNKPASFDSAAAEEDWMEKSREEAFYLQLKLETGLVQAGSMPERIIAEPMRTGIPMRESERFIAELTQREDSLIMENNFVKLVLEACQCLGQRRAYVGRCLELLNQIKEIELNQLLLLRNPVCVDIIRRFRKYVGNLELWKMNASDEEDFNAWALAVRQAATSIYANFRALFHYEPGEIFWDHFCEKVQTYWKHKRVLMNGQQ